MFLFLALLTKCLYYDRSSEHYRKKYIKIVINNSITTQKIGYH